MSVIYMDVGAWQSREKKEPTMTFGLVEHNAIALCTYYSSGELLGEIPDKYDFKNSLINKFLTTMMENKYGQAFKEDKNKNNPKLKRYHIIKILTFQDKELLDDKNQLRIFIPDLHLHYFKDTYLDNFITWRLNYWKDGRPNSEPTFFRVSMEGDFVNFINSIIDCKKKYKIKENVMFLGDIFDLWESVEAIRTFCVEKKGKNYEVEYYKLQDQLKNLKYHLEQIGPIVDIVVEGISNFIRNLYEVDITKGEVDSILLRTIDDLSEDTFSKLLINYYDNSKMVKMKARYMSDKILEKYGAYTGSPFKTLLKTLAQIVKVDYIYGNHDNFLGKMELKPPNGEISYLKIADKVVSSFKPNNERFRISFKNNNSIFIIPHGHNWDKFNSDDDFTVGYSITKIVMLYESKGKVDVLKDFEETFFDRNKLIESINKTINVIEDKLGFCDMMDLGRSDLPIIGGSKSIRKNKVVIMGHTHEPYLDIIRK